MEYVRVFHILGMRAIRILVVFVMKDDFVWTCSFICSTSRVDRIGMSLDIFGNINSILSFVSTFKG